MKLWLDDIRPTPDDTWTWAKSVPEAIELLKTGEVTYASLDHDLGDTFLKLTAHGDGRLTYEYAWKPGMPCPHCDDSEHIKFNDGDEFCTNCSKHVHSRKEASTGYDMVKWMAEHDIWPSDGIMIHSWNPPGADRMRGMIDRYGPYDTPCPYQPDSRQWTPA